MKNGVVGYFEPSAGLALAVLLIGGKRYALGMLFGAILINEIDTYSFRLSFVISSCDILQALFGAWLLTARCRFNAGIQSMSDYLHLILLGGCISVTMGTLISNTALLFFGFLPPENYLYSLLRWWMSDTLGVILVAPLILICWKERGSWRKLVQNWDAIFPFGLMVLAGQIIFLDLLGDKIRIIAQPYLMFLPATWVAVRLGTQGTMVALNVVAVQALLGSLRGISYFSEDVAQTYLVENWLFVATLSIVSMMLATYFTEKSQAEEALRSRKERFQALFDRASDGIVIVSPQGQLIAANESFARMHGYTKEEIQAMNLKDLDTPEAFQLLSERLGRILSGESMTFEVKNYHKDGHTFPLEVSASLIFSNGEPLIQSFVRDITERKQFEEKLQLAANVFIHARESIMITSADGRIIDVNDSFSELTGYRRDEVIGHNPRLLSSGIQKNEFYAVMWQTLVEQGQWCGEVWNRRKSGEIFVVIQTISAVHDDQGNIRQYVALFSDITSLKEHEKQLERFAHYDTLTGLPNRVLLADRLEQAMIQTQRRNQRLAVAFLDLDGFKTINDNHGHESGDQLLIAVAACMRQALREGDTIARLGGDEFVAVMPDLIDLDISTSIISRLLSAASQQVRVGDKMLQVTASLGVTFYPQAYEVDADQLLRQADNAMYQAKLSGKNCYHIFDAEKDSSIRSHHEQLECIRLALAKHEFVLYYQPKVNMRTGAVIGAEALIRWLHPERGLLQPRAFLSVVEDHALAIELGEWVIEEALTQVERWHAEGLDIPVSVNVGTRQLQQDDFVQRLRTLLANHPGVKPGDLMMEVLETSALEDLNHVSQVINACKEIGVMFALDDFGTGYSSLTYLKQLPVIQIKIDQSFVSNMLDSPDDLTILEGILGLASAFQHQVIAEGVESLENGEMLLQLGCEMAQGNCIAYPMQANEISGWSNTWRTYPSWSELPTVSQEDFPLLFASVNHRSWIAGIEVYLKGESKFPPPIDRHQCRFGMWLDTKGQISYGNWPAFETIKTIHQQVHVLGAALLELHARGMNKEALAGLDELQGLRDGLLGQLRILLVETRK